MKARVEIKNAARRVLTDTESGALGVVSDDPDINGCVEIVYDYPAMFLPGHTHIIPELAVWHRMHERDITADEAVRSFVRDNVRDENADVVGIEKAVKLVRPMPEKMRAQFDATREAKKRGRPVPDPRVPAGKVE